MSQPRPFAARPLDPAAGQPAEVADPLLDPARLGSIARQDLLAHRRDVIFDRASTLASRLLGTPMALVSIVTDEAQHLIGAVGLDEELDKERSTPLSHSFCQHVVRRDAPLIVDDAPSHPLVSENLAIPDLGVKAYLGVPLRDADGQVLGSFCVLAEEPRSWTDEDLHALQQLAEFVRAELLLRDHLDQTKRSQQAREDLIKTVAHDLRAAVTAVTGSLETLDAHRDAPTETRDRLVDLALRQGVRIREMMDSLLDAPRAAGLEVTEVDLATSVEAAAAAAISALGGADRVDLDLEPVTVITHPASLERALINLIRNALQHTDGAVRVACERDRDHVIVTVSDQGPGLPEWLLASDLGDASLRGRAAGHGIGLFSAVTLIRALGGELTVDTGRSGTQLIIALPALTS